MCDRKGQIGIPNLPSDYLIAHFEVSAHLHDRILQRRSCPYYLTNGGLGKQELSCERIGPHFGHPWRCSPQYLRQWECHRSIEQEVADFVCECCPPPKM